MTTLANILVLIPAYNEGKRLGAVLSDLQARGFSHILVVDDGSQDPTREVAVRAGVPVISHLINRGQGAAIQTGFEAAKTMEWEALVTMDGDGQCDPGDLIHLANPVLAGTHDMVVGNRFGRKNTIPLLRRLYNHSGSLITWLLSGTYYQDTQSGMRAYSQEALRHITIEANGYEFCSDVIRQAAWAKLRTMEVPIRVFYSSESLAKGQSFARGLHTVSKLVLRSIMRH